MGRTAKLVVATDAGGICNFEVDSAETIENIKALIEVEVYILLQFISIFLLLGASSLIYFQNLVF